MILKTFVTGMLENNNYLLIDETSKEAEKLFKTCRDIFDLVRNEQ